MRNVFLFLALLAVGTAQEPKIGQMESGHTKIGQVHREVAETSPVAKMVIERVARDPRLLSPYKIAVRVRIYNISDHEINYQRWGFTSDVTDIKAGKRAPETPTGCYSHFFSDCYTWSEPMPESGGFGRKPGLTIEPNKYFETTDLLDSNYRLDPGDYSVVGYFCAAEREGPECLKSNKITITVPAEK